MKENKTQPNDTSVEAFVDGIFDQQKRSDSQLILEMMRRITQTSPQMWGESIVGFGNSHYKYASGREGEWFKLGFSPRKQSLTLYLTCGLKPFEILLSQLGKHKVSVSCLYINKLSDINLEILEKILQEATQI